MPRTECIPNPTSKELLFVTETTTGKCNQSKCRVVELSPSDTSTTQFLNLWLGNYFGSWGRKIVKARWSEAYCKILTPRNFRTYTHKVSPTWLPKLALNKDNTYRYVSM